MGIAVIFGVLILSVNAAFGVTNYNPEDVTGVSPTFTALDVNNDITTGGDITATNVSASNDLNSTGTVSTVGLVTSGDIQAGSINSSGNITGGAISGSSVNTTGDITTDTNFSVGDDVIVTGGVTTQGLFSVTGNITGSLGAYTVGGDVYSGGDFSITDNLFFLDELIFNATGATFKNYASSEVQIGDIDTYTGIGDFGKQHLDVVYSVTTDYEPLRMDTDTDVVGHLSADSFGNFYKNTATGSTSTWGARTAWCDSNDILIDCFGGFSDITDSNNQWVTALQYKTLGSFQGCYLNVFNNLAFTQSYKIWASCLDTDG